MVIRTIVATDSLQQAIRPVLLLSALTVLGLVMVRQLVTIREQRRVAQQQAKALEQLTQATRHMEEQAHQTAEQQTELERGIEHLRNVQASLANGDLQARATLTPGALWPLAANLNLMAERLARTSQETQYAQRLVKTLAELSVAIDRGMPFDIPASCYWSRLCVCKNSLRIHRGVCRLCRHSRRREGRIPGNHRQSPTRGSTDMRHPCAGYLEHLFRKIEDAYQHDQSPLPHCPHIETHVLRKSERASLCSMNILVNIWASR